MSHAVLAPSILWCDQQTEARLVLRPKPRNRCGDFEAQIQNRRCWFWGPNQKTRATDFEAKLEKTIKVVLRPNHSQTVGPDFETQPRNPRFSSPRALCRPHTVPLDISIFRPPSTRRVRPSSVLCTRSPTPTAILIAARHAAPATYTPWDKEMWFSNWNKG
jgi:hypothetical protein